jgi:hypothetical protein
MIPDIDGKENCPGRFPGDAEQSIVVGIVDGKLAQDNRILRQVAFQLFPDIELSQTGMGIAAVYTDNVKHQRLLSGLKMSAKPETYRLRSTVAGLRFFTSVSSIANNSIFTTEDKNTYRV